MDESPDNRYGAFATRTQVGGMLGLRQAHGDVYDELLKTQRDHGVVDANNIDRIAEQSATCHACVRGVASFYSLLDTENSNAPTFPVIRVCDGPSCCLRGGGALMRRCREIAHGEYRLERSSCLGYCEQAPVMMVDQLHGDRWVASVAAENISDLQQLPPAPATCDVQMLGPPGSDRSRHPLTKRFGVVDARSIEQALSKGAYLALSQALNTDRDEIIEMVGLSGLRGYGGAGFKTAEKWRIAANTEADCRYVICNADESEPGTFKDRMLMENDPHLLLEGMAICGRAIGAQRGIIYIRGEYRNAAEILEHAISDSRERGFLGRDIQGSDFQFNITVHRGAGAYICGEESALLESLEGRRGEPRDRPPFPATSGYQQKPTVVNNVETFCCVPSIIHDGPEQFRQLGQGLAAGTKLFCLSGHIARPGLCEAAIGVSLRQVIHEFGGGMMRRKRIEVCALPAELRERSFQNRSWTFVPRFRCGQSRSANWIRSDYRCADQDVSSAGNAALDTKVLRIRIMWQVYAVPSGYCAGSRDR